MTEQKVEFGKATPAQKAISQARGDIVGRVVEKLLERYVGDGCGFILLYRPKNSGVGTLDLISNGGDSSQVIYTLKAGVAMLEQREELRRESKVRTSGEKEGQGKGDAPERE